MFSKMTTEGSLGEREEGGWDVEGGGKREKGGRRREGGRREDLEASEVLLDLVTLRRRVGSGG